TDANGRYTFTNLGAGQYLVAEEPQTGWIQSALSPRNYQITVLGGQTFYSADFGNIPGQASVEEQPPEFTSTAPTLATAGPPLRFVAMATDPAGDPLTYDLVVTPPGMTIDAAKGIVVWVPTADQVGGQDVTLRVRDGRGGVALQSFQLAVSRPN